MFFVPSERIFLAGSADITKVAGYFREILSWPWYHNLARLSEDHANARLLAERLAEVRGVSLDLATVQSNIVIFQMAEGAPDAATVVRPSEADLIVTDGPFVEATEHIAGFYIINADDLDAALAWARKVVDAIGHPIEVRPFRATGRVQA